MITMQKLGVVKKVSSEEKAARLEKQGFERVQGSAEPSPNRFATMKDLREAAEAIYAHMSETFQKMGEEMYDRLHTALTASSPEKPKATKASKKEGKDGGADQPDRADGAK